MHSCNVPLSGSIRSHSLGRFYGDVDLLFYFRYLSPLGWDPTNSESEFSWWYQLGPDGVHKENPISPTPDLADVQRPDEEGYYLSIYDHLQKHKTSKVQFFVVTISQPFFGSFISNLNNYTRNSSDEPIFILPWTRVCYNPANSFYTRYGTLPHLHRHMIVVARDGDDFIENCFNKIGGSNEIETLDSYWKRQKRSRKIANLFFQLPETCDGEDNRCSLFGGWACNTNSSTSWKGQLVDIIYVYFAAKVIVRFVELIF